MVDYLIPIAIMVGFLLVSDWLRRRFAKPLSRQEAQTAFEERLRRIERDARR